jgi:hypothetical protein
VTINSIIIPIGPFKNIFSPFFVDQSSNATRKYLILPLLLPLLCVFDSIITKFFKSSLNIYDDEVLVGVVVVAIHVFVTLPNAFAETVVDDVEKILAST